MLTTSIYPHHPRNRNFQIATLEIFSNPCPEIQSNTGTSHKDLLKIWVDIVDRLSPWLAKKPPFDSDTRTWSSSSLASWSLIGQGRHLNISGGYLNNRKWMQHGQEHWKIILSTVSGKIMHFGAKTSRFKFTNFLSLTHLSETSKYLGCPNTFIIVRLNPQATEFTPVHSWSLHTFTWNIHHVGSIFFRPWYNLAMQAMHATAWPFETHKSSTRPLSSAPELLGRCKHLSPESGTPSLNSQGWRPRSEKWETSRVQMPLWMETS